MRTPVIELSLPGWEDPETVFKRLNDEGAPAVWLDCGPDASSGVSYIGFGERTVRAAVSSAGVMVNDIWQNGTIFDFLRAEVSAEASAGVVVAGETGFRLGWVGWLGYGLHRQTVGAESGINSGIAVAAGERGGRIPAERARYPDAALIFVDRAIAFDHASGTMSLIALDQSRVAALLTLLGQPHRPVTVEARVATAAVGDWTSSDDEYRELIAECQRSIVSGDAYQLCLTAEVRVAVRPDPLTTYLRLRHASPSHHGAFFRVGEISLLSSSPETFLSVSCDGVIESRPIKGTRRRGRTPAEDVALKRELAESEKEQAENLMIVDLMRNDIGRVSAIGSVEVPALLEVESYAQVHQLVSTVRARLAPGLTGVDVVVACFPAGSMTGAPKRSAIAILGRLEQRERGVYAGAFGYFGLDGRVELAMVIRSIMLDAAGATIGTGGGITALSIVAEELAEIKLKAAVLLAVLDAS